MGLGNLLLLTQTGGYSVSIILSLCCIVPLILNISDFKGHCLLFSSGEFLEVNGLFAAKWASFSSCSYTLIIGILLLIVSIVQLIRMSIFLYKGIDRCVFFLDKYVFYQSFYFMIHLFFSSFLSAFWDAVVSFILVLLTLIDAIIVTSGFSSWCSAVTQRFASCETATVMSFTGEDKEISPTDFFIQMVTVQVSFIFPNISDQLLNLINFFIQLLDRNMVLFCNMGASFGTGR